MQPTVIGRVTATEKAPTTCCKVRFWVDPEVVLRPFDIVRISHLPSAPGGSKSCSYAIIQDLEYITDSSGHLASFISSDFGDVQAEPMNDRLGTTIAEAEILYNNQDVEMPIRDGAPVEWADVEGIKDALGLRGLHRPVPAGYLSLSNNLDVPIAVEADYLIGPEGAHVNIAGISGLATKTSYALFLLSAIQQSFHDDVTIVVFNVKGRDLLALDEANPLIETDHRAREEWEKCGLEPKPFDNVTYLYPFANAPKTYFTSSHAERDVLRAQIEQGKAWNYFYDLDSGIPKLALLFSDVDDSTCTMESIVHKLHEFPESTWPDFRKAVKRKSRAGGTDDKEISVASWRKFQRLLQTRTEHDLFTERHTTESKEKRQKGVVEALADLHAGSVLVVDVEPLPDYLQSMVLGDVVQTILGAKLSDEEKVSGEKLGTVVVFADELNKYAPRTGGGSDRTLTRTLLEVSERGRSLGVILFGAEQFRSHVHDRIHGNCSTNVFGRTSPIEIAKCQDYRYFPDAYKASLTRLRQGSLLLQHAVFKTSLVKVKFPHPAYYQPKG
ncbi:MAG: ATP-binding protein [Candidatus Hydrogenedentes bacterium]|nr:ATP-binding protein [Candidatus Hydrogenedentota bacterium]